jgi:aspartyl-tRNA(Asn)/glutamyl-tRNA(Gln) amidotransferase subunit C
VDDVDRRDEVARRLHIDPTPTAGFGVVIVAPRSLPRSGFPRSLSPIDSIETLSVDPTLSRAMSDESTNDGATNEGTAADTTGEDVTAEDVRHVAGLARVDLDDDEVDRFTEQFGAILEYFETLDDVPETDAEPDLVNVLRADETREGLRQAEALRNAPETEDGYFKGPRVS